MALAAMPALVELELHGIGYMSEALELELSAAPQPAFAGLTSLTFYGDEDAVCRKPGPALYLWLGWVLPTATQLRKLCLSCDFYYAGEPSPSPSSLQALKSTLKVTSTHHYMIAQRCPL